MRRQRLPGRRRAIPQFESGVVTSMKYLPVYLNDHLAGSVGALQMLDGLIQTHEDQPLEPILTELRRDIESDQN